MRNNWYKDIGGKPWLLDHNRQLVIISRQGGEFVSLSMAFNGRFVLNNFGALFSNPWLLPSYLHNQLASLVTASFVVAAIGAFYLLNDKHHEFGRIFVKTGVIFGFISSVLVAVPTGDLTAKNVVKYQPATFAAMEGIFHTEKGGSEIVLIGQPNTLDKKLECTQEELLTLHKMISIYFKK